LDYQEHQEPKVMQVPQVQMDYLVQLDVLV
jgi:hypothetical protein